MSLRDLHRPGQADLRSGSESRYRRHRSARNALTRLRAARFGGAGLPADLRGEYADDHDGENDREGANPRAGLEDAADNRASRQRERDQDEQQDVNPGHPFPPMRKGAMSMT